MQARILHSWKEIASYIGRGIRTVQRYEVQFDLPVHRPSGRSRSSVMAFSDEIDAWLTRSPTHSRQDAFIVEPSEMRSKTVLNGNRANAGIDTCPLCCGTGKISNSKHIQPARIGVNPTNRKLSGGQLSQLNETP